MKTNITAIVIFSALVVLSSCKGKNQKEQEQATQTTTSPSSTESTPSAASGSDTKIHTVTATPDSVVLGKNSEALIKIRDIKAIELSDADGKVTGMEMTYRIELTNKNPIGGSTVALPTTNFRLELDNGTKVSPNSTFIAAEPDATKLSDMDKFTIPAGAKPTVLNLFFDETRASVKLSVN